MKLHSLFIMTICAATLSATGAEEVDIRRDAVVLVVEKVAPAVVNIATERMVEYRDPFWNMFPEVPAPFRRQGKQHSLGSGVFIDEGGYLITNYHVVQRASKIAVILNDGTQLEGRFISGSQRDDIALVQVSRPQPFPYVDFVKANEVYLGETVVAIGNPFGFGNSVARGIISSKERAAVDGQGNVVIDGVLQTDAAINPGNSGGPLIDLRGDLVGINTAIVQEAQNIGFAIPAKRVVELLAQWLTPEKRKHVWFGAKFRQDGTKVRVAEVQAESPVAKAGVREGDIVVSFDGKPVDFVADVLRRLLKKEEGQRVKLELNDGRSRVAEITLVAVPKFSGNELAKKKLGMQFQELTPDLVKALALTAQRGLVVTEVERNSSPWDKGLRRGHVVARVGGSDVNSLDDVARVLEDAPPNVSLSLLVISSSRQGNTIVERMENVVMTTR